MRVTNQRHLSRAEALRVIQKLLEAPMIEFDDEEGVARAFCVAEDGVDFGDALIQGAMDLFGVNRVVTFDQRAAKRLGWELLTA